VHPHSLLARDIWGTRWLWGRGRWRNLSRRERRQNEQLLETTILTCCSWLVPLRFILVFRAGSIYPPVHGPSLQRICLQAVSWEKLTMSCCRVIFVVVSAIKATWLASVVMNFERGHEGRSWAFGRFGCANSKTICNYYDCLNRSLPCENPLDTVCCFVLLTRGWGRLETRPPVALGSSSKLSAFTMSLAPPVHPPLIFLSDTENL